MIPFLITGMPRSGTTWCANFFTTGSTFCYHEAMVGCATVEGYAKKLYRAPGKLVGDSDSGIEAWLPAILKELPYSPLIVIDRNQEDVAISLHRLGHYPGDEAFANMLETHKEALDRASLVIPFSTLFEATTLRSMWDRIGISEPFSMPRWEMLTKIKVDLHLPKYLPWYREGLAVLKEAQACGVH